MNSSRSDKTVCEPQRAWGKRALILAALALGAAPVALAEAPKKPVECLVASSRVRLADVLPTAPEALRDLDLGPAPLPGSSRLITRAEIVSSLPGGVTLPDGAETVRVLRKTSTVSAAALEKHATDALARTTIARGGALVAARPRGSLVVPDGWQTVDIELPRLPRRAGKLTVSAALRFREGATVVATGDVPVDLTLPESAAIPDVKRGAKALFVVRRGSVEIRAVVAVGDDADVGDVVSGIVQDSGHAVRGRVVEKDPPLLEEVP